MEFSLILFVVASTWSGSCFGSNHTLQELVSFMNNEYENASTETCRLYSFADWTYETNLTDENSEKLVEATLVATEQELKFYQEWFRDFDVNSIQDPLLKGRIENLKMIGTSALNENDVANLTEIINRMTEIYGKCRVCPYNKQDCEVDREGLRIYPDLIERFSNSRNYDELLYLWRSWKDLTGKKMRNDYKQYVALSNKAAKLNGFRDAGEMWRSDFETDDFVNDLDRLWKKVEPLYNKLHAFIRQRLIDEYGIEKIGGDGLIPAHLLRTWTLQWNTPKLFRSHPYLNPINVTESLVKQKYTPLKMFETANEFYLSLGLENCSKSYDSDAMIVKPKDRQALCHPSAHDLCDQKTFRIKMCTEVNENDFMTIHHEMGHIQYFQLYKNQPYDLRDGANPGFHEAVGDLIALSATSPTHLKKIGLIKEEPNYENIINFLMNKALSKVASLPFVYILDRWRWDVFSGKVPEDQWNQAYWQYKKYYQKVKPPEPRCENDFDPGATMHVASDYPCISFFVATILEFQLYKSFCIASGQYDPGTKSPPLYMCDFYQNKDVGNLMRAGLSLGSSKHWREVLRIMTNESDLDASAILEYFEPLSKELNGAAILSPTILSVPLTTFLVFTYFMWNVC